MRRTLAVVRTIDLGLCGCIVLWRELLLATLGAVAVPSLISAGRPGWALGVLLVDLAGVIALLRISVSGGHLQRASRWSRLRWASGLRSAELVPAAVARLATLAEGILRRVARAPAALGPFVEPAVEETVEVVRRAVSLQRLADQHRQQLASLDERKLDEALDERLTLLDQTRDVELRLRLAEGLDAIDAQRRLARQHQQAVARIEGELDAAEQSLAAAAAGIEGGIHALDAVESPDDRLPVVARLRQRVDALSSALAEVGGR
jgi:hypothetical protein